MDALHNSNYELPKTYFEVKHAIYSSNNCIIIIIIKRGRQCKAESNIHPLSPKNPAPQYQPIDKNKRKEKIVEDYCRGRAV